MVLKHFQLRRTEANKVTKPAGQLARETDRQHDVHFKEKVHLRTSGIESLVGSVPTTSLKVQQGGERSVMKEAPA